MTSRTGTSTESSTGTPTDTSTESSTGTSTDTLASPPVAEVGAGAEIPDETAGPYPSDGSNGPNVLTAAGIVRSDITTSIGELSGTAAGVPLTLELTIVDASTGDALPGAALYAWHCTADGRYSMYEITDQNYLRGVQIADSSGRMAFTTVFPGCYQGRWPHVHIEIFDGVELATSGRLATKTSQIALPRLDCEAVYADATYGNSAQHLARLDLATDNVFADGWESQLATMSGDPETGYTASLLIRV